MVIASDRSYGNFKKWRKDTVSTVRNLTQHFPKSFKKKRNRMVLVPRGSCQMKNPKLPFIVFTIVGFFVLILVAPGASETTYSYDFTLFGKPYKALIVTNSDVSNITMTPSGMGIQFQASVPSGTTGFFNVTVPDILLGTDITVLQDGAPLTENLSYTKELTGTDYFFHLEYAGGTRTFAIEASTYNPNTPTPSPPPNQSGFPSGALVVVAAIGAVAAVVAAVLYAFKGAIFHTTGGMPSGGGGVGSTNVAVGTDVTVYPHPEVRLTFNQVKMAGEATATPLLQYPALPEGIKFRGTVFDIKTTAVFTGLVIVGLVFAGKNMSEEDKEKLRVYRHDLKKDSVWEDVTSSIDTKNNVAYGATDHFSVFGVR